MLTIDFTRREKINDRHNTIDKYDRGLTIVNFLLESPEARHQMRHYEALGNKGVMLDDLMVKFSAKLENS
jgi:hypothetical protein